jgi:hypothetical protein
MAFTLPIFNASAKVYDGSSAPQDVVWSGVSDYPCQKYSGWKHRVYNTPQGTVWYPSTVVFRFEPTTFYSYFVADSMTSWNISLILLTTPSGECYRAITWELANTGFPNEYPFVVAYLCRFSDGMPIHPGSANNHGFPGGWPYQMGPIP